VKKTTFILSLFILCTDCFSQDYLYPLESNTSPFYQSRLLKPILKTGEIINYVYQWDPPSLPFEDDFTSNLTLPKDLSSYLSNQYYMSGSCVEFKKFKRSSTPFSNKPTYRFTFNGSKPPFYHDSTIQTQIGIALYNDVPICNLPTILSFYPATPRNIYSSTGVKIDSTLKFDTTISVAYIQELNMKGILWTDNYVYINSHFPYLPIGKGVATFDGLNENGRPYQPDIPNAEGLADHLTSVPLSATGIW
jgi:hypothetical protein